MNAKLACGDNNDVLSTSPRQLEEEESKLVNVEENASKDLNGIEIENVTFNLSEVTTQLIDDNEVKLKERIAQCRSVIESLKNELNEEKSNLEKESKVTQQEICEPNSSAVAFNGELNSVKFIKKMSFETTSYSASLNSRLNCDENLIEYEKQLQRYQNTLNMAQKEKKNAIRKQMLSKAFNLKLLEVENQCNIELLRVKQSLQCLEPLRMIANKWKASTDDTYDFNRFELIPRYPELNSNPFSDFNRIVMDSENKSTLEKYENKVERK